MTRTTAALLIVTVMLALAGFISLNLYLFAIMDRSTQPAQSMTFAGKVLTYECNLAKKGKAK